MNCFLSSNLACLQETWTGKEITDGEEKTEGEEEEEEGGDKMTKTGGHPKLDREDL